MDLSYRVLIVDDVPDNIHVAMNILKEEGYSFSFATDGYKALEVLKSVHIDLVLLDIMMPGIDGFEVCRRIKSDQTLKEIPIIFLTAKVDADSIAQGFDEGAVDYVTKPFHPTELLARVKNHIELYTAKEILKKHNLALEAKAKLEKKRLLTELEENQKEIIYVLTEFMESTSDETGRHIRRVAEMSRLLAHYHPALSEDDEETIFHAAPMHDIGKITIPYEILHKPGRLSEEEFSFMKRHTTNAHEFLKYSKRKIIKAADIIAHEHHEKWNGEGYPRGLKGEDIHLYGRVVALADVFDALTHNRVYKDAWSIEKAVEYIKDHRETQFDPKLVDIFLEHLDEFVLIVENGYSHH
ncbi:MAG: response regulator [Sulfurimonadaceae bacterium]|nr:response regulator [Sulfurimonadaceae bacterium]